MTSKKVLGIIFSIFLVFSYLLNKAPENGLVVYALDIGQGDAILIKTEDDKYVLVDGGPDEKVLKELQDIIPYWQRTLDLVILTHPDQDHVGGLEYVLDYYDVKNVVYHPIEHDTKSYENFKKKAEEHNIENYELRDSDDFQLGCCTYFDILWPEEGMELKQFEEDANDISISFVLMSREFSMFFGGDLPSKYEEKIFAENIYDLDAIKVGHHGSRSSTSQKFLELTKPEYAVISVGENNRYGHPTDEVLNNLEEADVEVYRTDKSGRIELQVDERINE